MHLTLLNIYLIGSMLVLGIDLFLIYVRYERGDDISFRDVLSGVLFLPLLSWFCLIIMFFNILVVIDKYADTPIIKGKK